MDGKMLARVGAIVFIAAAVTATAIEMTRKEDTPIYQSVDRADAESVDPLRAELIRCAGIGEAGPRDRSCLRVRASVTSCWSEAASSTLRRHSLSDPDTRSA